MPLTLPKKMIKFLVVRQLPQADLYRHPSPWGVTTIKQSEHLLKVVAFSELFNCTAMLAIQDRHISFTIEDLWME